MPELDSKIDLTASENTTSDTSGEDITDEIEVDANEVKMFSVEELVPSSTPMTVPYLEIYRTNELEFIPYISPYNVGVSSSDSSEDSSSDSGTDSGSENSENTGDGSSSDSSSSSGSSSSSTSSP